MEVDVPRSAEALLSNELAKLASEVTRFQHLFAGRVVTAGTAPIHLCRFAQELAIYSRGAVVEKLCKNILVSQENPSDKFDVRRQQDGLALLSARILVHLASSRVVGNFCVRNERIAWGLLDHFVESVECLREPNREKAVWRRENRVFDEIEIDMWIAFFSTAGVVYFSRASKLFRGSMRVCPGLLPALEFCLTDGVLSKCSEAHSASMRLRVANIIEALSFSADSQEWMIEQGFLKLTARVYETSHLESRQDAGHVCSMSLFRLSETLECVKLMKQKDLYSMLKPHIKQIEGHYGIWPLLQDRLLGRAKVPPKALCKEPGENWRRILVDMYASGLPTVCSWRGCSEPEENVSGKRFSKCSRCHVAHYCSKEHQTLHWPLHKKHCLPPKRP